MYRWYLGKKKNKKNETGELNDCFTLVGVVFGNSNQARNSEARVTASDLTPERKQ